MNNSSDVPPANALSTNASFSLLFTVPASGVSKGSLPSETDPKLPYELLPFVARITPPASARYPTAQ